MILFSLALDRLVFCLRPRKKMTPRMRKKRRNAAVMSSGANSARSDMSEEESTSPSSLATNLGRKPKYLMTSCPLGRPQGTCLMMEFSVMRGLLEHLMKECKREVKLMLFSIKSKSHFT